MYLEIHAEMAINVTKNIAQTFSSLHKTTYKPNLIFKSWLLFNSLFFSKIASTI